MKPSFFEHRRSETLADVVVALEAGAKIMAGGQSLGPMLNLRLARPATVVGLNGIAGLGDIRVEGGKVVIGAAVTHARIEDNDFVPDLPPMLRHVARGIAYRAVRNRGTVGGSLAHADPAADWVTTMTALDATLSIARRRGKERQVAMSCFMLGAYRTVLEPGEMLTAVTIRAELSAALWGYHKVCRKVGEFADAIGAAVVHPESRFVRLVCGATGGAPLILTELGAELARTAAPPARATIAEAVAERAAGADDVKLHLLTTALHRSIEKVFNA